jgi:serine/threonine protein kinase/Tol biopolymer transport system component
MIGQAVLHYKILEKLGEGGMGVVYKAQDTKLNRTVALKFLPPRAATSSDEKARFLKEAQAAAALNHPNICTIYGVDEHDGQLFIAMEFIEGGTLRDKLPFANPDDAFMIALQIGEALQEAHAKGIVHRDVKAENIMLSAKGQAKVMDFGLAKLKGSMKLTRTSSTVGTLGYMAPEQIQGGEVDHRSDVFSFGVLLFEMLTGKLPFRGEHEAAMVYSIVNEEPQDIATVIPDLPPIVVNLIQRCLEKDPNDRYQHFDDIVADLRRSLKKTSRVMRSSTYAPSAQKDDAFVPVGIPAGTVSSRPAYRKPIVLAGVAVAAIVLVVLAIRFLSGPSLPEINPGMEVSVLQIPATEYQYPAISPDGKWLAFTGADLNGNWDVYVMHTETGESRRLTTDSTANMGNAGKVGFSPDGSFVVYGRIRRGAAAAEVCVVSVLSGSVRVVADTGIAPVWSPAGDRIFYYRGVADRSPGRTRWREYWSVSPQGTDARIEAIDSLLAGGSGYFTLAVSPDGRKLAFTRPMKGEYNELIVHDLHSGAETQLTDDRRTIDEAVWLTNGYILYSTNRSGNFNVWALPEKGGRAVQVTRGAGPDYGISASTAANRMVFSQRSESSTLWMVNTDGTGHRQVYPEENIGMSHISPDGKSLALVVTHPTLNPTLMIRDLTSGRQEMLFPHDSSKGRYAPLWSPSGKSIAFVEVTGGNGIGKIIHLAGGRRVQDVGRGLIVRWRSDSTVIIFRDTSHIVGQPNFNVIKKLDVYTGEEEAIPERWGEQVLNNSKVLVRTEKEARLLTRQEFQRNAAGAGTLITKQGETSWSGETDEWAYYATARSDAVWRFSFKTLQRSKITDLQAGYNYVFWGTDYADRVMTYTRGRLKTSIVKVDNMFVR